MCLLLVKATALKQQIRTEASFNIYDRPVTDINVIAIVCVLNLRTKMLYLLF